MSSHGQGDSINDSNASWYTCRSSSPSGDSFYDAYSEQSTVSKNLEMDLNLEAMEALQKCLLDKIQQLRNKINENNEKLEKVLATAHTSKTNIMKRLDMIQRKTDALHENTKGVIVERDEAMQELRNVEQSFSDVHRKYEKAKIVLENLKCNEDVLIQRTEELEAKINARDKQLHNFKHEAKQVVERLYGDFTGKVSEIDSDNSKLQAQLRRTEMRIETLDGELEQKRREYAQLNALADELIGKSHR